MPTTYNGDEEERRLTSAQRERTRASCLAKRTAIGIVFASVIVADWLGWRSIGLSCAIGQSQGRGRIGLGFNADFLIDALSVMDVADAVVEATQARQPAMLRELEIDGTLHVVMPVYLPS